MQRNLLIIAGIAFFVLILIGQSMFIVRQDRQAIVLRFGEYVRTINAPGEDEPGLYFKMPFVESVVIYDRRNLGITLGGQAYVASDQERLIVDAMVRWQIADARRFYQSAFTEQGGADRLEVFTEAAMRSGVSQPTLTRAIQRLEEELGGT
ncbi:MAG TPA: SPFH domain-containing protein, partial [Terricaulis sp.]|nr:SPFH domain-containing protein [Terricaulis sp.]